LVLHSILEMIQTDIDHISSNENTNISYLSSEPQPITWTFTSITSSDTNDRSCTVNDSTFDSDTQNLLSSNNIDWEYVTKQLETVRVEIR
jgi:hypothetical protein